MGAGRDSQYSGTRRSIGASGALGKLPGGIRSHFGVSGVWWVSGVY